LVCASSIEDYENNRIKKHEKTLQRKEEDRTKLADIRSANIGPVFLTYKGGDAIAEKVQDIAGHTEAYGDIITESDKVHHRFWLVDPSENRFFEEEFKKIEATYVADGHHRSAAAYNVGKIRR
jgi:uncharacterized protein (DUF1015 family)